MSNIKAIRRRLNVTQAALASGIGCTQGNVGHYENKGQTMPPDMAKRLIAFAHEQGQCVTFDDIYGEADQVQVTTQSAVEAMETTAQGV